MKNGGIRRMVFFAAVLAASAGLWGADHYRVVNGPKDFYFGHISYIEPTPDGTDPVVLREGRSEPEPGVLNTPIGPGDTVRTSADRRCEIQFDTGTIVRLDVATELRVETILARSLSGPDALSVLTLGQGRIYVMYKEYGRREMFQVLTANAAVKLRHNSVALVSAAADGTTETQVRYGRAQVLFGSDPERPRRPGGEEGRTPDRPEGPPVRAGRGHRRHGLRAVEPGRQRSFRRPPRGPDLAAEAPAEAAAGRLLLRPDLRQPLRRMALGRFLRLRLAPFHRQRRLSVGLEPVLLRPVVLRRRPDVLGPPGALGLDPVPSGRLAVGQETRLVLAARIDVRAGLGDLGLLLRLRGLAALEPLRLDVRRLLLGVRAGLVRTTASTTPRTGPTARMRPGRPGGPSSARVR